MYIVGVTTQLTPGSPAARIGLRTGDEIVEIESTSTASLTYQQALDLANSHADTLLLTVERYPCLHQSQFRSLAVAFPDKYSGMQRRIQLQRNELQKTTGEIGERWLPEPLWGLSCGVSSPKRGSDDFGAYLGLSERFLEQFSRDTPRLLLIPGCRK